MSREIDERIVAMYFDNKNFESGARETLKTLDQLKQSCNMEGVGKGFEALGNISKTLKLEKISQGASKVRSSLQTVGNVVKKAFSITPIDNFYHALMNFKNRYFDRVIGFDVAQKLASSLESVFRNLTIAPVSAGWSQYENTMDSIKTIMSSTGEGIDVVKGKLKEMTDYANLTIYSLNDMTSNLGKFTNNGVKLDDATNAMIGLANATADAGQGAQQASMAMYNVSQAIGVGKMTTIDWKSLENANVATRRLKNTFIQAALASGDLEQKVVKVKDATTGLTKEETQYWTKAAKGSKAEQVTVENFRDTLNKGWLTKEAMLKTFAIYSGQMSVDAIAAMGFSKKQAEEMALIGENALKAAQEVRTFSKMMDALRESAQSSWATSFEFIFGDMTEGTNLWTELNDKIDNVLKNGAKARNGILMSWRGMMEDENGQVKKIKDIYDYRKQILYRDYSNGYINTETYAARLQELENTLGDPELWKDYRDVAVKAFMDLLDTFISVGGSVKDAWADVFGSFSGDTLKNVTQRFRGLVDAVRDWLGSANDANSRISRLRKGLTGVFNVIKIGVNIVRSVIEVGWSIVKPFIDPLLNLFAKFGEWMNLTEATNLGDIIKALGEKFKGLWNILANLGWEGAFEKIGDWFVGIWTKIKGGIAEWLNSNGLEGVTAWFGEVRARIEEGATNVKNWWNSPDNGIRTFFSSIYESVTGWFKSGVDAEGNETSAPIVQFFYNLKDDVTHAFEEVESWWEGSGIPAFFERIWNEVSGWFRKGADENGHETRPPIVQFFYRLRDTVTQAFEEVRAWWTDSGIPAFFEQIWTEVSGWFKKGADENGHETRPPIVQFFYRLRDSLASAFEELSGWWAGSGIPDFFERIWEVVSGWFKKGADENGHETRPPIVQLFYRLQDVITQAFNEVSAWWAGSGIPAFFEQIWTEITGWFKKGIDENGQETDSQITVFFNRIWEGVQMAWEDIKRVWEEISRWDGWNEIGKFFLDTWNWISEKVSGIGGSPKSGDSMAKSLDGVTGAVATATESIETIDVSEGDAEVVNTKVGLLDRIFGTITGLIESAKGWITDSGTGEIAIRFFDSIAKIIETIAIVVEKLIGLANRMATGKMTGEDWGQLAAIFGSIGLVKLFELINNRSLAKIADNTTGIGETMLQIAGAIALVSAAIAVLGQIELGKLVQGGIAVVAIMGVLAVVVGQMSKFQANKALNGNEPVKAWERIVGKLISGLAMFGMMKVLVDGLPTIINALSEAKQLSGLSGDDIMKTMIGIMTAVSGLMLGFGLLQRLVPTGLDPKATGLSVVSALEIVGGLLLGMFASGGIMEIAKMVFAEKDIISTMDSAALIMEKLGATVGSFFKGIASLFGFRTDTEALEEGAENIKFLGEFSEGFTIEKTSGIARIMSLLTNLTKASKDINVEDMNNFSTAAEQMARGMLMFNWVIDGIPDFEGVGRAGSERYQAVSEAVDLMRHLFESFAPLAEFTKGVNTGQFTSATKQFSIFANDPERVSSFVSGLNAIIDSFGGLHDGSNVKFDGINIVKKMYDSIQTAFDNPSEDLPEFNATPVVDAILKSLNAADTELTTGIHGLIQGAIDGLATEDTEYDASAGVPGLVNFFDTMQNLSAPDALQTEGFALDYSQIEANINKLISGFNTQDWGNLESLNLPVDFNILGDVDEEGKPAILGQIETQLTEFQQKIDSGELDTDFEIKVRPVFDLTQIGGQMSQLRALVGGTMPVGMTATISLGNQVVNINDTNIISEIRSVKSELTTAAGALQRVLYMMDSSLGSKINGVTSAVRSIKLNVPGMDLQDIDEGLYQSAMNSALTGVASYGTPKFVYTP